MQFLNDQLPGPIDEIKLYLVNVPFLKPFSISSYTWTCKEALILSLKSGAYTGYGECVADPDPFYSPETNTSARFIIKEFLLPLLNNCGTYSEFYSRVRNIRGNTMAKATLENALLDLSAKMHRVALCNYLGLAPKRIMSGISIGIQESIDELLTQVQDSVDKKYHRVKMKIKKGKDIEYVKAVREAFPNLLLMADANGDYSLDDIEIFRQLDAYELMMIEQPLSYSDIYFHHKLQNKIATPLCLDESIHSLEDTIASIELGSCRIINIKQGRVGGIYEALKIARYCRENNIGVWSGGMDETGIGRAFNIHLQADDAFTLPGDTSETHHYFKEDIVTPSVTLDEEGYIVIPDGPGIGAQINNATFEKFIIGEQRLW